MSYLTPDNSPATYQCRAIFFPAGQDWLAILSGALEELTFDYNWEIYGSVSIEQTVSEFTKTFDRFCYNEGACRMVGEIVAYAGNASPQANWIPCDGRSLLRADYPDLFAVIGTNYGSSNVNNFNIPDLRSRTIVSVGQGTGLSEYTLGQTFGTETHELTSNEMPQHTHVDSGHYHTTGNSATGLAVAPGELPVLVPNPVPGLTGSASANIGNAGSSQAHENRQPSIAINYLIVVS